jgi:hypothetical protein
LEEVLADKTISSELSVKVARLRAKGTTFDKLDANTANDLRAIAEELKVSFFDLFIPTENLYRLKIIAIIENRYSGTLREKLEALQAELPKSKKISLALLGIYATQILPESLLNGSDLRSICKILGVGLEDLKELSDTPKLTISVESLLKKLGLTLDELAILLEIPKKFIPWISTEPKDAIDINPPRKLDVDINKNRDIFESENNFFSFKKRNNNLFLTGEAVEFKVCDILPQLPCCQNGTC